MVSWTKIYSSDPNSTGEWVRKKICTHRVREKLKHNIHKEMNESEMNERSQWTVKWNWKWTWLLLQTLSFCTTNKLTYIQWSNRTIQELRSFFSSITLSFILCSGMSLWTLCRDSHVWKKFSLTCNVRSKNTTKNFKIHTQFKAEN